VVPCKSNVKTITANATKMNRSLKAAVFLSRVCAAARVTTPRMPAQAITVGAVHGGRSSRRRMCGIRRTK
jgi:hypothetical protein